MSNSIHQFNSISEFHTAIADGQITVKAAVERYIKVIEDLNPRLNAVTIVNKGVLEDAESLDVRWNLAFRRSFANQTHRN